MSWTEPLFCRATQIKTYSWDNAQVILVGNKCDLEDDRLVPTEDGQRLAEELGDNCLTPPLSLRLVLHTWLKVLVQFT